MHTRPTPCPETSSSNKLERKSTMLEPNSNSNPSCNTTARRATLKRIADDTIQAVEHGSYELAGVTFDLQVAVTQMKQGTEYWSPEAKELVGWAENRDNGSKEIEISVLEISTLEGARFLDNQLSLQRTSTKPKIGVLSFASATKPGGGFLGGASAQEESIARSSTVYYSLTTENGDEFYKLHKRLKNNAKWKGKGDGVKEIQKQQEKQDKGASSFYSHAMIYSPSVLLFRNDAGSWLEPLSSRHPHLRCS
ncbi:hypothetical protein BT96DRAFT_989825 [Gymnopus androsaceus JB14]|uniref:Microbial-type PARG catalytic domain-containing protein n=1 Tax=Gymnopus androsaceus JB14 TaxID=1447944 RepID=A0A6A4I4T5_9AGAR|nr:hypothetical protein BT96DRAFT_989825 [Gymnopus androsaceus JB14]